MLVSRISVLHYLLASIWLNWLTLLLSRISVLHYLLGRISKSFKLCSLVFFLQVTGSSCLDHGLLCLMLLGCCFFFSTDAVYYFVSLYTATMLWIHGLYFVSTLLSCHGFYVTNKHILICSLHVCFYMRTQLLLIVSLYEKKNFIAKLKQFL